MGWLRLDDNFADHPKVVQLTDREYRQWTKVLLYCARYRTEGRVPNEVLRDLAVDAKLRQKWSRLGLLDSHEDGTLTVHDFRIYNPNDPTGAVRAKRYRDRDEDRDAKRDASRTDRDERRDANGPSRAGTRARPVPSPERDGTTVSLSGQTTANGTPADAGADASPEQSRQYAAAMNYITGPGQEIQTAHLADDLTERFPALGLEQVDGLVDHHRSRSVNQ